MGLKTFTSSLDESNRVYVVSSILESCNKEELEAIGGLVENELESARESERRCKEARDTIVANVTTLEKAELVFAYLDVSFDMKDCEEIEEFIELLEEDCEHDIHPFTTLELAAKMSLMSDEELSFSNKRQKM